MTGNLFGIKRKQQGFIPGVWLSWVDEARKARSGERYIKYFCRSVAQIVEIVPRGFSRFQTGYVFRIK
jgi:hypothetical protein